MTDTHSKADSKFEQLISHEIKKVLNSIIEKTNLILDGKFGSHDEIKQIVFEIQSKANSGFETFDNLMQISKLRRDNLFLEEEQININNVIREILSLYKSQIENKNLSVNLTLCCNSEISVDESIVHFIIRNILVNSFKYSKEGGNLRIITESDEEYLKIIVSDEGIGMDPQKITEIFESDTIMDIESAIGENKPGISLKLCKQYLRNINGDLIIGSKINAGTKITVKFPFD